MPPLLNSLGQATVNSIILFGVYRYLSLREKKDYLRIWSWGLFFQSIRFLFEIWLVLNNSFIISFLTHILNLLNGYFMVYGTYIFIDKKTPKVFGYLSVFNLLWLPMAYFANLSFSLKMLPVRLFVGIIYITIGIVFIKTINISGIAKYITGVTFILWGIHKMNYPFLMSMPRVVHWRFIVTSILEVVATLGILLVLFEGAKQIERTSKEELKIQHERFKATLESIGDAVITTDAEGVVNYMNPAAWELTGYSESEAIGSHISKIFHIINEYTGRPVEIPIEKVLREGSIKGLANHTVLIRKDGSMISIADSAAPIWSNIGEIAGVVMVFQNITGQREKERFREQLAFIVQSSHEAIFSIDKDYNIRTWNKGAEKIHGYKDQEIIGKPVSILAPKELCHELKEYVSDALRKKGPVKYETVRLRKGGGKVHISATISPIIDDYGNISGASIIGHDISDYIRSKEMLKRYKMLSDSTTDMILFVRFSDGRIIEANPAAMKALKYEKQELLNLDIRDLLDESIKKDAETMMKKALKGIRFEVLHRRKDGSTFPVEVNSIVGVLEGEQVLLGICRDITERKQYEARLEYMSRHDYLTGLYNRAAFDETLDQLEETSTYPFVIAICNIDGLKMINDTFGHEIGDHCIKVTAMNIKNALRAQDFIARTAGDEFGIILQNLDINMSEDIFNEIRQTIKKSKDLRLPIPLDISIGYAVVSDENPDIKEALKNAENNMRREKLLHGRSRKSSTIKTLVKMLEARDIITQGHSHRTERLAVKLAQMLNMTQRQIDDIKLLAIFHDVGKVGVPDRILFKKGLLTHEERLEMQRHTEIGHSIALSSPDLVHISDWILKHHEWWDGNGYPLGIKGEEIPLECRILAVVDAYDAMTNNRPYRKAMTHEEAMMEFKSCSGTQFDPSIVKLFVKAIEDEASET